MTQAEADTDFAMLAEELFSPVRDYVKTQVVEVRARIKAVEERPQPEKGEAGDKGLDGRPGEKGMDGKDGKDGPAGEKGEPGEHGPAGPKGDPGEKGDAGELGAAGPKGDAGEKGETGEPGEVGQKGDAGEKGLDGADGAAGMNGADGPKGDAGEKGEPGELGPLGPVGPVGPAGADGEDGDDGADCTDEMVEKSVNAHMLANADAYRGEPGPKGDKGEPGEPGGPGGPGVDGKSGEDGRDGRDAAQMDVLGMLEFGKRYQKGTAIAHAGGLILATRATDALADGQRIQDAGWLVILNGIAEDGEAVSDDFRTVRRTTRYTSGLVVTVERKTAVVLDRGVFRSESAYEQGDLVTSGGSCWIAQRSENLGRPGIPDSGWRLSTKAGRDGKDGAKGDKGEKGDKGRDLL